MGWWAQERPLLRCERSAITRTEIRFVTSDTFGCNVLSYVAQRRGSRLIRNCLDSTNVVERAGRRFTCTPLVAGRGVGREAG